MQLRYARKGNPDLSTQVKLRTETYGAGTN
jgi:hypothetical protein